MYTIRGLRRSTKVGPPRFKRWYVPHGGDAACLRPDAGTSAADLAIDHREKMARKAKDRARDRMLFQADRLYYPRQHQPERWHRRKALGLSGGAGPGLQGTVHVFANVGRHHEDYGMTPHEHDVNSVARQAAAASQIRMPAPRGTR